MKTKSDAPTRFQLYKEEGRARRKLVGPKSFELEPGPEKYAVKPATSKKPKKFKVRTYSKSARAKESERELEGTRSQPTEEPAPPVSVVASASSAPSEEPILRYVKAVELPEIAVRYQALLGSARPLTKGLASDATACKVIEDAVVDEVRSHIAHRSVKIGVEVARLRTVPGSAATIPLPEIKKGSSLYGRAEVNSISFVRASPVPADDPAAFDISLDLVTVSWGEDLGRKIYAATKRQRGTGWSERTLPRLFAADDPGWEARVRSIMFSTPLHKLPALDPRADSTPDFDPQCPNGLRALATLMARSQIPLGRALVGIGQGKDVLRIASARLKEAIKARCKDDPAILCEDQVPHYWFAELRRLGLDHISVPIVLIR